MPFIYRSECVEISFPTVDYKLEQVMCSGDPIGGYMVLSWWLTKGYMIYPSDLIGGYAGFLNDPDIGIRELF